MALIKCPECGKDVSDKAKSCPVCGCPISNPGVVRIKTSPANGDFAQEVSIFSGGKLIWKGNAGKTAEIHFDAPADVIVKYHLSSKHYSGQCLGRIDPSKSKIYNVSAKRGFFTTKIVLQAVRASNVD